jgi:hypothetical protein
LSFPVSGLLKLTTWYSLERKIKEFRVWFMMRIVQLYSKLWTFCREKLDITHLPYTACGGNLL